MEELLAQSKIEQLKEGSVITGTVMEIRPTEVVIDFGGKAEGAIPAHEFLDLSELEIGSDIEVFLERLEDRDGNPQLSFDKAEQKKNWEKIVNTCEEGSVITGRVRSKVKGGLVVNIGVDAFLPSSQVDIQAPKNLDQFVGQTFDFKVVKINRERKNIVVSRRELIEERRQDKKREILTGIKPGETRRGMVKNITDYGAFIDLDGLDGLLHITDMSWGRISHPSEMVKTGEEITVCIIEVDQKREARISGTPSNFPQIHGKTSKENSQLMLKFVARWLTLFHTEHLLNWKRAWKDWFMLPKCLGQNALPNLERF